MVDHMRVMRNLTVASLQPYNSQRVSFRLEGIGIAGSGEAARRAGGTGRCALFAGSVAASAARLLVRSEVLALKSAHSRGCVRAVLFRGGAAVYCGATAS